jgi:ATP-binding cassette, subfamily B, bacterial MsbA
MLQISNGVVIYTRLLRYVYRYWVFFVLGILGTLGLAATDAGLVWFLKPLINKGFVSKETYFIHLLPFILALFFIARCGSNFLSNYCLARVARSVVKDIRLQLLAHLLKIRASFFDQTPSGRLLSILLYNVEQVANASTNSVITLLQESFFILSLVVVMFLTSWQMTLLFLCITPIVAWIAHYSSERMRRLNQNIQNSMGEITQAAGEVIDGYRIVRIFGAQRYEHKKFEQLVNHNCFRELKVVVTSAFASTTAQLTAGLFIILIVYLATTHLTAITTGGFASMATSMFLLLKPMRNLASMNDTIQRAIAAAGDVFNILDQPIESDCGRQKLVRARGALTYHCVNFNYFNAPSVLHDINFQVDPGEIVALVGRSGSGKSTLISLLSRFYDHYTGDILIDDINIRDLALDDLRNQIAMVSQQITLFNDTVLRNIAYGLADVSEQAVVHAAETAHAMEFIRKLPKGLHTQIGENGLILSGGERQRIAIARALLKNAPILILDEATSSLDMETEQRIQSALDQLMRHRTTLVTAHRLSTVERADKILVLDSGRIVERGTHQQLLAHNGHYAKLYRTQLITSRT